MECSTSSKFFAKFFHFDPMKKCCKAFIVFPWSRLFRAINFFPWTRNGFGKKIQSKEFTKGFAKIWRLPNRAGTSFPRDDNLSMARIAKTLVNF